MHMTVSPCVTLKPPNISDIFPQNIQRGKGVQAWMTTMVTMVPFWKK